MKQNAERLGRENNQKITAEVQGNDPNFKQNLAEKGNFIISKISQSHPLFSKCRLRAAGFQKLTTTALSQEKQIQKRKIFPKSSVSSIIFLRKLDLTTFRSAPRSHEHLKDAED